ncbi:MAG: hypothetical protein WBA53_06045 [Burkholderiaceae bacterium]
MTALLRTSSNLRASDAHHNLAIIYLELGEEQRAIRHHDEVRRLERG